MPRRSPPPPPHGPEQQPGTEPDEAAADPRDPVPGWNAAGEEPEPLPERSGNAPQAPSGEDDPTQPPRVMRQDPTGRPGLWPGIIAFSVIVGIASAIAQILELLESGRFSVLWSSLLVAVTIASLIGAGVVTWREVKVMGQTGRRGARLYRLAELLLPAVSLLAVGVTIGVAIPVIFRSVPPPSMIYQSFESTIENDERFGLPVVLRARSEPPANGYKVRSTLGLGYPVDAVEIPGTHLVYDHFCTGEGSEEPCGGVRRSHFYSKDSNAPSPWPKSADLIEPVARLLDAEPGGRCPNENDIAIYSFSAATSAGAPLFDVAARAADDVWKRGELLGCLSPTG